MKSRFGLILGFTLLGLAALAFLALPASALDEKGCLQCHGKPELKKTTPEGRIIPLYVKTSELETSAHRFIDCTQCHPQPHAAPAIPTKLTIADKCGSCHQYEKKLHQESIHGQSLTRGDEGAATCVDCHSANASPHGVARVLTPESPTYRSNIANTCARCHGDERLMASYSILEKTYESYMRSYHGKVQTLAGNDLSKLDMATCTNCHGVHDIRKATDPASPVASLSNLKKVCSECHPGADENFARAFTGHRETSLKNNPSVYYTEMGFVLLTAGVVVGGLAITTLAFANHARRRFKR